MIQGVVTSSCEPTARVIAAGPPGQGREIEAAIETGYDGHLVFGVNDFDWLDDNRGERFVN